MITVVFVYEYEDRPAPAYAHNTRNGGRIAWSTQIGPNQTFGSLLPDLYRHSRVRPASPPAWRLMWHKMYPVNLHATPRAMFGSDYGAAENQQLTIYCVETLNYV
jgi:hypothetical protein